MLSKRDKYLMKQTWEAAQYYENLEAWLSEPISDAGHIVEQHLSHDADRLFNNITASSIMCTWCPKGYTDGDRCHGCDDKPINT